MNAIRVAYLLPRMPCVWHTGHMDDSYYTDADLEWATGLPLIHVRRLITWGAVSPAKGGKGVVRQWDQHAIRHIACVKGLYVAGLSLPMAHTLGMLTPTRVAIDLIDPRVQTKAKKRWFDPQTALRALERSDIVVLIADRILDLLDDGETRSNLCRKAIGGPQRLSFGARLFQVL